MADLNTDPLESQTRANLSYVLIIGAMIFIGYILYRWGDQKEILTLIIGLIGGSLIAAPLGVYFGASLAKKQGTAITGDNTVVNNAPTEEVK